MRNSKNACALTSSEQRSRLQGHGRMRQLFALLALFAGGGLQAATPVSGTIAQSTEWTLAGSPYVLSGPVTITAGAQLVMDAGIQVQMNAGAGLEIVNGSLSAQGIASNPITITSINDIAGSAQAPARGD